MPLEGAASTIGPPPQISIVAGLSPSFTGAQNLTELQRALDSAGPIPIQILPGVYTIAGAPRARAGLTLWAYGVTFNLTGVNSFGLQITGTGNDNIHVFGLKVVGSGVIADNQTGIGSIVGVACAGVTLIFKDCDCSFVNRGIYLDVLGGIGNLANVWYDRCTCTNIQGTTSGNGYGMVYSGVVGGGMFQCNTDLVGRHSVYVSASRDISVTGCFIRRNRSGLGAGQLGGLEIARSNNVTATGNTFEACEGTALDIAPVDTDAVNPCRGITVTGNTFRQSVNKDIYVGVPNPGGAAVSELSDVIILGNTFVHADGNAEDMIRVFGCTRLQICNNSFYGGAAAFTVQWSPIILDGGSTPGRTDDILIADNLIEATTGGGGTVVVITVSAPFCTGQQHVQICNNNVRVDGTGSMVWTTYAVTKVNLVLNVYNNQSDNGGLSDPTMPFRNGPICLGQLRSANFNITTDQAILLTSSRFVLTEIVVRNASVNMNTAAGGLYNATGKPGGGVLVAAAQTYVALTGNTKYLKPALAGVALTDTQTANPIYFSLTTAQGVAATADILIYGYPID